MSTEARSISARLAALDHRKVAVWTADRLRRLVRNARGHWARLRVRLPDPSAGAGRLPPGTLSARCMLEATADDRYYLRRWRRHGPIFKLFWGSGDLKICVIGFPLAKRLLGRHRESLHPVSTDITPLVRNEYLRAMQPEHHPHYRRLFKGALRDDLVWACEPVIGAIIRRELGSLAAAAEPGHAPAAQLTAALNRISLRTLLLAVLGVPPDSELVPEFEALYQRMGPDGYIANVGPEQRAAFPALRSLVLRIIGSMRAADGGGFSDSILRRLVREESAATVDDTVIGNAIYMVERGHHDLRDMLRWVVKYLSDHPEVSDQLRASLDRPGSAPGLAEACVLETLRMDQAEVINRKVMEPFSFEGFRFPRGSWISILMRESHRDPASFADPDAFRPQRFLGRSYPADQYAPFGIDEHQCIARLLALRAGTLFVEALVKDYTWSVNADGPRHYGHFHWQPSPSFAIDLHRRSA